jgi:hypothetical protein
MLYIFGDSFSVPDAHKNEVIGPTGLITFMPLEKNWTRIVSESIIGDDNHINDCVLGCSNEYIFHTLRDRESSFKSGDYVIVQLTSYYREWIFEDKPEMANFLNAKWVPGVHVTKEQAKALEMYKQYLHSDHRLFIHYDAIFDAITFRTKLYAQHDIRCLILPGFHNVAGVQGNMFETSNLEFDSSETCNTYYNRVGGDFRYNHFSEVNHKILANKVIDFFNTGTTVDLTTGFETGIYTKDNI